MTERVMFFSTLFVIHSVKLNLVINRVSINLNLDFLHILRLNFLLDLFISLRFFLFVALFHGFRLQMGRSGFEVMFSLRCLFLFDLLLFHIFNLRL